MFRSIHFRLRACVVACLVAPVLAGCSTTPPCDEMVSGDSWGEDDVLESFTLYLIAATAGYSEKTAEAEPMESDEPGDVFEQALGELFGRVIDTLFEDIDDAIAPHVLEKLASEHDLLCDLFGVPRETELDADIVAKSLEISCPTESESRVLSKSWTPMDVDAGPSLSEKRRYSFRTTRMLKNGVTRPEAVLEFEILLSPEPAESSDAGTAVFRELRRLSFEKQDDGLWTIVEEL